MDIDLNDPEVEKAAVKIQAGFKGMKIRKQNREEVMIEGAFQEHCLRHIVGDEFWTVFVGTLLLLQFLSLSVKHSLSSSSFVASL